jgi:futalosine hydrolase
MSVLIVAATSLEVNYFIEHFDIEVTSQIGLFNSNKEAISLLITGLGMVNTSFQLGKHLSSNYNLAINVGICGAFDKQIQLGEVLQVTEDCLIEMGAEDGESFIRYSELNLGGKNIFTNLSQLNLISLVNLKKLKGVTVNKISGNEAAIVSLLSIYNASIESMEGAAFFSALENTEIKYLQLRAVSNYIEKRDKSKWKIELAIRNLNSKLIEIVQEELNNQNFK